MPEPVYTLTYFAYQDADPDIVIATIQQTIDGNTWSMNKRVTGQTATDIWAARGETEAQLIARILAAA